MKANSVQIRTGIPIIVIKAAPKKISSHPKIIAKIIIVISLSIAEGVIQGFPDQTTSLETFFVEDKQTATRQIVKSVFKH